MNTLTIDELGMRELTENELQMVSGGWTTYGAGLVLTGTLVGIAGIVVGTIGAPVWAVVAGAVGIGAAAVGGLAYAYDAYSEYQQSTPQGTVTVEELSAGQQTTSVTATPSTGTLATASDYQSLIGVDESEMGYISYEDDMEFGDY